MNKKTKAASISASISIAVIALLTIMGELVAPFKDFMQSVTGHHWVTKGVFSFVLFIVLLLILSAVLKKDKSEEPRGIYATVVVTLLSGLAIAIFYIAHYFGYF